MMTKSGKINPDSCFKEDYKMKQKDTWFDGTNIMWLIFPFALSNKQHYKANMEALGSILCALRPFL